MALGKLNSYVTDTPLQRDYIGNAMAQVEDSGFKYREEKRLADAKKEAERKANEVKDDFDPKVELTGNQSINDLSVPFAMQSAKRYSDNVNKINATTNPAERTRYIQENQKIKQNFDNYAQVPKIINTKMAEILAGVKEGKLNPRDAERAAHLLDGLNSGKAKISLDENSIPRLTTYKVTPTGELELDAQGKPIVLSENQDLASLMKSFEVHTNSNFDKSIVDFADKFKLDETGYEKYGNEYTKEKKDERTNRASIAFAKSQVSQPGERFELSQRLGIDENDIPALESAVAQQFKDRIAEKDIQKHDYAYDNFGLAKKKADKEEITIGTAKFGDNRSDNFNEGSSEKYTTDKDGKKHLIVTNKKNVVSGNGVYQNIVTVTEGKLPFKNLGGSHSGINGGFVEGFTIDKKTGDIIVTGKALKEKGVKFKMPDGKLLDLLSAQEKLDDGNTPENVRASLKAQIDNYSQGDNYGTFVRRVPEIEVSNLLLKTPIKTIGNLKKQLKELNPDETVGQKTTAPPLDEGKIQYLMKQNKGATREQIIEALKNQK